jgi:predicted RNA-binding Zn-ribbon protein involved in translation (DUF1610 family)
VCEPKLEVEEVYSWPDRTWLRFERKTSCDRGHHNLKFNTPLPCPDCGRDVREQIIAKTIEDSKTGTTEEIFDPAPLDMNSAIMDALGVIYRASMDGPLTSELCIEAHQHLMNTYRR